MAVILCHGGMFSGKSDLAIGRVRALSRQGLKRVLYQPKENCRDIFRGKPVWYSRAGGDEITLLEAEEFKSLEDTISIKDNFDVFGFEEWQMYSTNEIYETIKNLHESDKFVVAAGLDYYFNGEPVEIFDKLRNLKGTVSLQGVGALCQSCLENGKKNMAVRTQRNCEGFPDSFDAKKIVLDGSKNFRYDPVCLEHWNVKLPINSEKQEEYLKYYLSPKGII